MIRMTAVSVMKDYSGEKMERLQYPERVKCIATIAVVLLHTLYALIPMADGRSEIESIIVRSARNIMMFAVPCFVMVTGSLLLQPDKEISLKKLFKKYILRIVLALITFSLIYACLDKVLIGSNEDSILSVWYNSVFIGTGYRHMWYLYLYLALYFMLPVYKVVTKNIIWDQLRYLLLVLVILQSIIPFVYKIFDRQTPFYICVYTIYPFYLFAGYSIRKQVINISKHTALILIFVFLICEIMITILCIKGIYDNSDIITDYSSPIVVLGSMAFFSFIVGSENSKWILGGFFKVVSDNSFGIYLVHMPILKIICFKYNEKLYSINALISGIVIAITVFTISLIIVGCVKIIFKKIIK